MKFYLPRIRKFVLAPLAAFFLLMAMPFLNDLPPVFNSNDELVLAATSSSLQKGTGLNATYFNNINFTGSSISRVDPVIHFAWGTSMPYPSIYPQTYSVRWTGKVLPNYTETYTFYTHSDDGVRLWVNNKLIIDNWTDHPPVEDSGQIQLSKNVKVDIKMEFYENAGDAMAKLFWSSPSTPKQIIPQSQLFTSSSILNPTPTLKPTSTIAPLPTKTPTPIATPAPQQANTITSFVTLYGWADNTPSGYDIAYPGFPNTVHKKAGGTGTYNDPITFASDPKVWPIGTRLYVPYMKKYIIMEDICGGCVNNKATGKYHIDIWMHSDSTHANQLLNCEYSWTRTAEKIEVNPPSTRTVVTTPLFNPTTGACLAS